MKKSIITLAILAAGLTSFAQKSKPDTTKAKPPILDTLVQSVYTLKDYQAKIASVEELRKSLAIKEAYEDAKAISALILWFNQHSQVVVQLRAVKLEVKP